MIELLITHISIWCPALAAILGVVAVVIVAVAKVKKAINEFRKTDDIQALTTELKMLRANNQELSEKYSLLLDEVTKIHNYYNDKKKRG